MFLPTFSNLLTPEQWITFAVGAATVGCLAIALHACRVGRLKIHHRRALVELRNEFNSRCIMQFQKGLALGLSRNPLRVEDMSGDEETGIVSKL